MLESLAPQKPRRGLGRGEGQRALFPHVPSEVALPLCDPARPGTQPDEDGGTLNCTGASLGSRTRLCLPGKLRASEAAGGEVAAAPQRGRLVQGSQPGPALMLGPAAHSPRASPGGEPHSLTLGGTDCASFSAPPDTMPSLPLPASAAAALPASRARPYPVACLPSSTGTPPSSRCAALILASFTFPPPESCRQALPASGTYAVAKRKCEGQRAPAPGRSTCEGGGGNAGLPTITEEKRPSTRSRPETAGRSRRAVCCDTMEGGGGSGNKTTGGLAGFFGAGGAGYSHADLAGVPRKYRA